MLYQIECIQTKRKRKLVIIYVIVLLLVLCVSIGLGIFAAKNVKKGMQENKDSVHVVEIADNENNDVPKNEPQKEQIIKDRAYDNLVKNVNDIYNGKKGKRVFLTFDDGPSKTVTPHILDVLKENNVKATFFLLGNRVKLNSDLVKREYEEGHYIANHGYSHKYSKIYASSNEVLKEYNKTEKEIQKALGNSNYASHLFRYPGGSIGGTYSKVKKESKKQLKEQQIAYLDWNALTSDAAGANTKEQIMKNLKKTVGNHNNVVVLMHDAPDKILTYETLNEVIAYLKQKGYTFQNMYDLM